MLLALATEPHWRPTPSAQTGTKCYRFVYAHQQLVCSKNGTDSTFIPSTSQITRLVPTTPFEPCHGCSIRQEPCDLEVGVKFTDQDTIVFGPEGQYRTLAEALKARAAASISPAAPVGQRLISHRKTNADNQHDVEKASKSTKVAKDDAERRPRKREIDTIFEGEVEVLRKKAKSDDRLFAENKEEIGRLVSHMVRKELKDLAAQLEAEVGEES